MCLCKLTFHEAYTYVCLCAEETLGRLFKSLLLLQVPKGRKKNCTSLSHSRRRQSLSLTAQRTSPTWWCLNQPSKFILLSSTILSRFLHKLCSPFNSSVPKQLLLVPRRKLITLRSFLQHVRHRTVRSRDSASLPSSCVLHLHHRAVHRSFHSSSGACSSHHPFLP